MLVETTNIQRFNNVFPSGLIKILMKTAEQCPSLQLLGNSQWANGGGCCDGIQGYVVGQQGCGSSKLRRTVCF